MAKIILVADDDRQLREMMKRMLTDAGYAVWTAGTWIEIRDAIRHESGDSPSCFIIDALRRSGEGKNAAESILKHVGKPVIWTSAFEPAPPGATAVPKGARFRDALLDAVRALIGEP